MQLPIITTTGTKTHMTVNDNLFAQTVNSTLLAQAVRVYLSNLRKAHAKAQTRSDVKRTSKKVYRQKGTGNARHGDKTANIFVGGGVAHGPTGKENWQRRLTKALKQTALKSALKTQIANIIVNDEILSAQGKAKKAAQIIKQISQAKKNILVVLADAQVEVIRSLRNLNNVYPIQVQMMNVLDVLKADQIIFTQDAIKLLEKRFTAQATTASKKTVQVATAKPVVAAKPAAAVKATTTKKAVKKNTEKVVKKTSSVAKKAVVTKKPVKNGSKKLTNTTSKK